jgi:hypothetical protein
VLDYQASPAFRSGTTAYHYDALCDYRNVEVYRYTADDSAVVRSSPLLQRHDQALTGDRVEAQFSTHLGRRQSDWAAGFDVSANDQTRFPRSLTLNVSTVNPLDFTTESFFDVAGMVPGFVSDRTNNVSTFAFREQDQADKRALARDPGWAAIVERRRTVGIRPHRPLAACPGSMPTPTRSMTRLWKTSAAPASLATETDRQASPPMSRTSGSITP